MSNSSESSHHCCIVCETNTDDLSTIGEIENTMKITSLSEKFNRNLQPSDTICLLCVDSMETKEDMPHRCETPYSEGMDSSSSEESSQADSPWNIIIVNQIPLDIDCEKLISVFLEYGTIVDTYLCGEVEQDVHNKHERLARITFSEEDEAWNVWEASQRKLIKYDDHVLMITVTSDDFSPIQNLPTECLREIFLRVHSVADKFAMERVCKRWNTISRQSWSSVTKVSEHWPSDTWRTIASRAGHSLSDIKVQIPMEPPCDLGADFEDFKKSLSSIEKHCVSLERFMVSTVDTRHKCCPRQPDTAFWESYIPHLYSIISKNQCLKRLSLWGIPLEEGVINSFSPDLEEIHMTAYMIYVEFDGKSVELSRFQNLQALTLWFFGIEEDQLKGIETLENLKVLNFMDSCVHPSNFDKIVHFTKLEYLAIPYCAISHVTLSRILRNNKGLKQLDISGIERIKNSLWQCVLKLEYLEVLLMTYVHIDSEVEYADFSGMPALKTLKGTRCQSITDETIEELLSPTSTSVISRLYVEDCRVTLKCLQTAKEWVSRTGQSLTISVSEEIFEEWEGSKLGESCSNSSNITGGLRVAMYREDDYFPQNDWDNYNLVITNDEHTLANSS